ncbi:MAG: DUF2490 domain-containing protein [Bacteroidetes bacterium]|nr:DUF2490 domain-containing protein [Bacteroidota bacterium]
MNHIQIKIFKLYRSGSFRSTNKVFFIITLFILFFLKPTYSQNTQIWLDADVYLGFGINWDYKVEAGYRKYLVSEGWTRYHLRNVFTYKKFNWILFAGALDLFYTNEDVTKDYLEVRPWIQVTARWMTAGEYLNLFRPYFGVRLEERFFRYSDKSTDQKKRLRFRFGGTFTLNNDFMRVRTWYVPFRFEIFLDVGGEAQEVSADQTRIIAGIGYIFNSASRAEFNLTLQNAENTISVSSSTDLIFHFTYKQYF